MADKAEDRHSPKGMARIGALLKEIDGIADPRTKSVITEIVSELMDLHGAGLEKILDAIASTGPAGLAMIDSLAKEELVSSLLLLYDLHPMGFEERIAAALEKVQPYLASHGGHVELLGTQDGIVRLRLQGSCHGCPSSAITLKQTIETAILEIAPDVAGIEVEGETKQNGEIPAQLNSRVALPILAS